MLFRSTAEYTIFSSAHRTFSRIEHILGHKSRLSTFQKIEIISNIFSDHNAMRLEMNYREKSVKNTNTWRLNNMLLNNQEITDEIKEEIKACSSTKGYLLYVNLCLENELAKYVSEQHKTRHTQFLWQ